VKPPVHRGRISSRRGRTRGERFRAVLRACMPAVIFFAAAGWIPAGEEDELVIESTGGGRGEDVVKYDMKKGTVIYRGGVRARRDEVSLSCDSLVAYLDSDEVYAEGHVMLSDRDLRITAERAYYDFRTHRGVLERARIVQGLRKKGSGVEWVVYAERLVREDRGTFRAHAAWISTCGFKEPHYRLACTSLLIKPGAYFVAKNMVVWIGKVPVFYYPYFRHDLQHEWLPRDFDLGSSSTLGDYLKAVWEVYANDVVSVLLRLHFTSRRGTGVEGELRYRGAGCGEGELKYYTIRDDARGEIERHRWTWRHYQKIEKAGMILKAHAYSYSDADLGPEFFYGEYQYNREYAPYIHAREIFPGGECSLFYGKPLDAFQSARVLVPGVLFGVGPYTFGRSFYLACELTGGRDGFDYGVADEAAGMEDVLRERTLVRIEGGVRGTLGVLSWNAAAGSLAGWYDRYLLPEKDPSRSQAYCSLLGTAVVGDFPSGREAGFRHVFEPYLFYFRAFEPTIENASVDQLDAYDDVREDEFLRCGFSTSLFRVGGEEKRGLFSMEAYFDYYPDVRLAAENNGGERWGDVFFAGGITPLETLGVYVTGRYDAGERRFEELFSGLRWKCGGRAAFQVEDYRSRDARDYFCGLEILAGDGKWSLGGYVRYDAAAELYSEWRWFVTRLFHMWECTFILSYDRQRGEKTAGVKIRLLADDRPDIAARQGSVIAPDALDDYMFFHRY